MSIFTSRSKKGGFGGLFGSKKQVAAVKPTAQKQLDGAQLARLFDKSEQRKAASDLKPSGLQVTEIHDRNEMSALRGALYSRK